MNICSRRLEGKVAVVTGVGSGIGKGCALMFARHGARVMGCDIHAASAEETFRLARAEGLAFSSIQPCDVSNPSDVECLMKATAEQYDGIDILVNSPRLPAQILAVPFWLH